MQFLFNATLANQVLDHMYEHSNYYASFHGDGSTQSMLKQAEEFLFCGKYILNIADVCVVATANYLHMNLYIFENLGGKAVITQQRSAIEKATKGLFLCFTCKPNGTGHENHYNAIVDMESIPFYPIKNEDKSKPSTPPTTALSELTPISAFNIKTEVSETTPTLGLVDIETIPFHPILNQDKSKTPTPTTDPVTQQTQSTATTETAIGKAIVKPEPKHPLPHTKSKTHLPHLPTIPEKEPKEEPETEIEAKFQPEIPEFEPDFQLPNSPDSTTPEPSHPSPFNLSKILPQPLTEFIPPPAVCRRKWAKSTINMSAFANVQPQAVERIPWIPDGDHIYLIKCDEDHWHDKQIDGWPW